MQHNHILVKGGLDLVGEGLEELDHPLVLRRGIGHQPGDAVFPGRFGQFLDEDFAVCSSSSCFSHSLGNFIQNINSFLDSDFFIAVYVG